ncbi:MULTISPECIES: AsnC family transcriptional regulator [Halolamina]|uniref:DNA-binding transcriptional regulator, Lrp family n=1 Tax=Halolamina pelagica TaxID=699431 RepID=A0A1I5MZB0_9EURY|nr:MULTISPECIES: AsnC family transcriptional regulator [Halolamina]NHX36234.1 AsnC family transcriptional regulator [Halolamina sp. R1-12]SFP14904.1 DNA-binding transcriptional regulator, Lrp family [Halolamina pelagica]
MRDLDETDLRIIELLAADARQPYSDIGDDVGLSGPAVSDRVKRLQDSGVLKRFTVDVDRSQLRAGVPVFVRLTVDSGMAGLRERVSSASAVEHLFVTADGELLFYGRAQADGVRDWLADLIGDADVREREVSVVDDMEWTPALGGVEFALTCAECGNTVDSEGETERLGGDVYHFCCPSCRSRFVERYERMEAGAE